MDLEKTKLLAVVVALSLVSGLADAQGFVHAAKIWHDGRLVWSELGKSAFGFVSGLTMYWLSLRFMNALGILTPEVQTLLWFGVTLVGVAIISGKVLRWPLLDQTVAVAVLAGIGWLLVRTSG